MIIPFSSHWKDSGGAGKHRGGVGAAELWVTHHGPYLFQMAIADDSRIQTPQPLFGGYAQPTCRHRAVRRRRGQGPRLGHSRDLRPGGAAEASSAARW